MAGLIRILIILIGLQCLLSGCGSDGQRSPADLLRLTVSGLSAREQYTFNGESVGTLEAGEEKTVFIGTVQRHDGLKLKQVGGVTLLSSGSDRLGDDGYNPSALLEGLLRHKAAVKLDEARSDSGTACLIVTPRKEQSQRLWRERLDKQWKGVQTLRAAHKSGLKSLGEQDWSVRMNTLQARTEYVLLVDRHRLVPISLTENSTLTYNAKDSIKEEKRRIAFQFHGFH